MHAFIGDRIVVRTTILGGLGRDGEIIGIERTNGAPPYRVRWSDDGRATLFFPGPDAYVDPRGRSHEPTSPASAEVS
jgi:hypothetical protein